MGSYMGHEYDSAAPAPKPKYKVGQPVRVVKDGTREGGSAHGADIGEVFKVFSIDELGVYVGDWYLWWGEFAAAFQPGDSVRVTRCNAYFAAGDTGVVVSVSGDNVTICTDDCPIVCRNIEADKLEWLEIGELPKAGAEPKPKFKAGDHVTSSGADGEAGVGVVLKDNKDRTYQVKFSTWYGECCEPDENLTLVTPAPCPQDNAQPCIVARIEYFEKAPWGSKPIKQPLPAGRPHVHPDSASAIAEAERLARNNPGQEYAVYQRVAGRVAEVSVEMKGVA